MGRYIYPFYMVPVSQCNYSSVLHHRPLIIALVCGHNTCFKACFNGLLYNPYFSVTNLSTFWCSNSLHELIFDVRSGYSSIDAMDKPIQWYWLITWIFYSQSNHQIQNETLSPVLAIISVTTTSTTWANPA